MTSSPASPSGRAAPVSGSTISGRDGHAAQSFGPVVDAQTAREQAVTRHILEHVVAADARGMHGPGHERGPGVQVPLRVADGHGRTRGAAGTVHAHEFGTGHAGQPLGVLGAQIVLAGKGQATDVLRTADALGAQARVGQHAGVKGRSGRPGDDHAQAFHLGGLDLIPTPGFGDVVVFHNCSHGPRSRHGTAVPTLARRAAREKNICC